MGFKSKKRKSFTKIYQTLSEHVGHVHALLGNCDPFDDFDLTFHEPFDLPHGFRAVPFSSVTLSPFFRPREKTEAHLQEELSTLNITSKDIVFAHCPPLKILDRTFYGGHPGSSSVLSAIHERKPHAWFCGHIHEAHGFAQEESTAIFNVACNPKANALRGFIVTFGAEGIISKQDYPQAAGGKEGDSTAD